MYHLTIPRHYEERSNPLLFNWIASFLTMTNLVSRHCELAKQSGFTSGFWIASQLAMTSVIYACLIL